jgi:putative transposase
VAHHPSAALLGCTSRRTSWRRCRRGSTIRPRPGCAQSGTPSTTPEVDAAGRFAADFAAYPKAVAKIGDDLDALLAFYDFPVEHWKHLRTSNPIESAFATVRLRQRVTKGPGCREAGLAMAFKLLENAQARWRRVNGYELVAVVRAGGVFVNGKLQERMDKESHEDAA